MLHPAYRVSSDALPSAVLSGIITSVHHADTCHSQLGIHSSLWDWMLQYSRKQELLYLYQSPPSTALLLISINYTQLLLGPIQAFSFLEGWDQSLKCNQGRKSSLYLDVKMVQMT